MIITYRSCPLTEDRIRLERGVLAPVHSSEESRFFSYVELPRAPLRYVEILTASIQPRYWPDLWRIELETYDKIGNTYAIMSMLASLNIKLILSESSVNSSGRKHTSSFLVDCSEYASDLDGDFGSRYLDRSATLSGLRETILLHFIDILTINDRGYPRVKIARLSTLYWAYLEAQLNRRELLDKDGRLINDGYLNLPRNYVRRLEEFLGDDLVYSSSTDTKNRVVRTLIYGGKETSVHSARFRFDYISHEVTAHFLDIVRRSQANLLKHNISLSPDDSDDSLGDNHESVRIDLTFEFVSIAPRHRPDVRLDDMIELIMKDRLMVEANVAVLDVSMLDEYVI